MRRRALVVGNWKMNGGLIETARELASAILAGLAEREGRKLLPEVVICPPSLVLHVLHGQLGGSSLKLGAQNMSEHERGAHTGEICGIMLRNAGCRYVILGHSERRALHHETDDLVARKMAAAFRDGLHPIVCLGETLEERDSGRAMETVDRQLAALLPALPEGAAKHLVLAYEPVWAIGTGRTASPDQVQEVHAQIRSALGRHLGEGAAARVRILYGGSVKPDNAATLFKCADVDGGLIGGASLKAQEFLAIVDACPDD